ncbi:hypothetical protein HYFRA_00010535 [Hymenoscyphus fraxineus]|uniref:Major facilitator superfamily (MFS) profile domain-containing protein n=1 Tax=Hymenoscyphus fraxineus TaxID=746836 RepID=A0A9N9LAQ9_9HELO|nr:hypothetical protein HYFRA_00010535 [Hymenoscyphus fraxineus]
MTVPTTITSQNEICVHSTKDEEATPAIVSSETAEETTQQNEVSWLAPWYQCANCFFLNFISWGFVSSFGMTIDHLISPITANIMNQGEFQSYYEDRSYHWANLRSRIPKVSDLSGMLLVCFGNISVEHKHSVLAVDSLAVLSSYFSKRRAFALGISGCGSPIGGILFPILFHKLQPRVGFGWTVRITALIMLGLSIMPVLGMRMRTRPATARKLFDTSALAETPFLIFNGFLFLVFMGSYIPLVYIQVYGSRSIGGEFGHYLLPIMNLGSCFGRIIPPYFADKIGPMNVQILCVLMTTILGFVWIVIYNTSSVIIFSLVYGFFFGAVNILCPNITVLLTPDLRVLGVRLGMCFLPISIGVLIGTPIAGALRLNGWISLKLFTGSLLVVSFTTLLYLRVMISNEIRILVGPQNS